MQSPREPLDAANQSGGDPYAVDAILRACEILKAFHFQGETLHLRDIVKRTGLHKATAFRAIHSLTVGGLVERVGSDQYRCRISSVAAERPRLGYAAMTENSVFSRDVTSGLRRAALAKGVELVEYDNRYSAKIAIRNAGMLVKENIAAAIEVQIHEKAAEAVAVKFREAKIPLIAVDIPHPGAIFFGADNYAAGRIGGRALGEWAQKHLDGRVDAVILLGLPMAGAVPAARMTGVTVGIKETLPNLQPSELIQLDGKGGYVESMEVVRKFLLKSRAQRILVGAMNDASALGALRAIEEAGRAEHSAIVGQNATATARCEIRRPGTHLIASVAFFPETYGETLVEMALQLIQKKPLPPAVFVKHTLITAANVDRYYPNDAILTVPGADALLWNFYH